MGPGTSLFGAALAHHAVAPQQHALNAQAQAAQTMLAGDPAKANHARKAAQATVTHHNAAAEAQRAARAASQHGGPPVDDFVINDPYTGQPLSEDDRRAFLNHAAGKSTNDDPYYIDPNKRGY